MYESNHFSNSNKYSSTAPTNGTEPKWGGEFSLTPKIFSIECSHKMMADMASMPKTS